MTEREEIRELLARYADGVNRRDIDAWSEVWMEDGISITNGVVKREGREAIVALYAKAMNNTESMLQLVHNGYIDVDGDSATGRWYVSEHHGLGDGKSIYLIGVYQDRYVRTTQGWKFAERHFDQLYLENRGSEKSGTAFPFPGNRVQYR